jgi:hypothetical protein
MDSFYEFLHPYIKKMEEEERINLAKEKIDRLMPWVKTFLRKTFGIQDATYEGIEFLEEETILWNEEYILTSMINPDFEVWPVETIEMKYKKQDGEYAFFCYDFCKKEFIAR